MNIPEDIETVGQARDFWFPIVQAMNKGEEIPWELQEAALTFASMWRTWIAVACEPGPAHRSDPDAMKWASSVLDACHYADAVHASSLWKDAFRKGIIPEYARKLLEIYNETAWDERIDLKNLQTMARDLFDKM